MIDIETTKERLQDLKQETDERKRAEMLQYLEQLSEPARRLLVARYYHGCSWRVITDVQGYSNRQCKRVFAKALVELSEIL